MKQTVKREAGEVVAECWTCGAPDYHLATNLSAMLSLCHAAGHDVRPVARRDQMSKPFHVKIICDLHGSQGVPHDCKPGVGHKCYKCDPPRDVTVVVEREKGADNA